MQAQFDFHRAEQLGMVERWQPPKVAGVSCAAMKHVLRAIDSYGRGREAWPSIDTLARDTGLCRRQVLRAVAALEGLSLLVIERRGPLTLNHYRIVWSELALRSDMVSERSDMVSERSDMVSQRSDMVSPKTTRNKKETTTTGGTDVVVVEVGKVLAKAERAVAAARARGASDVWISERCREWWELPAERRLPGTLFNWLALEGSYTPPRAAEPEPMLGRGDGLSRDQVAAESLRLRIVRAGRAAGATPEAIERKLAEVGV